MDSELVVYGQKEDIMPLARLALPSKKGGSVIRLHLLSALLWGCFDK